MLDLHNNHLPKNYNYHKALSDIVLFSNNRLIQSAMAAFDAARTNKNILTSHSEYSGMTNEESSHACVDSVNSALDFCLYLINKECNPSRDPFNRYDYIEQLCYLSGCYGSIESHYNAVLYGQYDFYMTENEVTFMEKLNNITLSSHECQYRKLINIYVEREHNRLDTILNKNLDINEITIRKNNRKKEFIIGHCSNENKVDFYFYFVNFMNTFKQFKDESISKKMNVYGFNPKEISEIYAHVILLTKNIYANKLGEIFTKNHSYDERSIRTELSLDDLKIALTRVSKVPYNTIDKIINFLIYDGSKSKDLWAFPLIKTAKNKISLLLGASTAPMPARTVEFWLKYLGLDFTSKGSHFESYIVSKLKEIVKENKKLNMGGVDIVSNIELDHKGFKGEIDLLIRVDDHVLIIDLKSIISLDSPVSMHNSIKRAKKGADQVQQQIDFIKKNTNFFENLTKLQSLSDCKFYPYILASNYSLTGCQIDGVTVIDKDILFNYFSGNDLEMLHSEGKAYALMHLYKDINEMKNNFDKYFRNPIETTHNFDMYNYVETQASYENDVFINRLVRRNISREKIIEKLKKYEDFTIIFSKDINEIVQDKKINFL